MVDKTQNWSKNWKSSKKPSKQRKYVENAPLHVKDKLLSARAHEEIREELEIKTMPVKIGDRVKVMTGDHKGKEGIVTKIDRDNTKIYANAISKQRQDGTQNPIAFPPSNLRLEALNIDDPTRLDKYEDVDVDKIEVDEEEVENALEEAEEQENEMMQQMQQGETDHLGEEEEEEDDEEDSEDEETEDTTEDEEVEELEEEIEEELEEVKEDVEDLETEEETTSETQEQEDKEEGEKQ